MTPEQETALGHPCLLGEETMHPRFAHVVPRGSLVLSVNAGYE